MTWPTNQLVGLPFAPPYSDYFGAVGPSIKSSILPVSSERHRVGFFAVDAPRKANADQWGIDRIEVGDGGLETFA
jgi:hypothetical protein